MKKATWAGALIWVLVGVSVLGNLGCYEWVGVHPEDVSRLRSGETLTSLDGRPLAIDQDTALRVRARTERGELLPWNDEGPPPPGAIIEEAQVTQRSKRRTNALIVMSILVPLLNVGIVALAVSLGD